ncbi:MAG: hypothetical protein WC726_04145, partial [Parcubacteria group bacterium]
MKKLAMKHVHPQDPLPSKLFLFPFLFSLDDVDFLLPFDFFNSNKAGALNALQLSRIFFLSC